MIGIGVHLGGPEQRGSAIDLGLRSAMNAASLVRADNYDDGTNAWINPIFVVPGSVSKPEFSGFKLGYFSAKKKGLVVVIEVPQAVADGVDIAAFVGSSLRHAVQLASMKFAKKRISFSSLGAEKIIMRIESAVKRDLENGFLM